MSTRVQGFKDLMTVIITHDQAIAELNHQLLNELESCEKQNSQVYEA